MHYMGKQSSKLLTAGGVIKAGPGHLISLAATFADTADELTIYDNATEASGTVLLALTFDSPSANTTSKWIPCGFDFLNGAYADFTGGAGQITKLNAVFR